MSDDCVRTGRDDRSMQPEPQRLRLIVISPCRDEAAHLEKTIDSVVAQTHRPDQWLIVDDSSSDRTPEILAQATHEQPWIESLRLERSGTRQLGPGVVSAFNAGLECLGRDAYD